MTTPSNPHQHPEERAPGPDQPTSQSESVPQDDAAEAPPSPTPAAPPSPAPTSDTAPAPAIAYPGPFAPVTRAPRTPWVNPVRRPHLVAAAIVGALISGGGGILIGHAITDQGGNRDGVGRFMPGHLDGPGSRRGQFPPGQGVPPHRLPDRPGAPTPAPSGNATS